MTATYEVALVLAEGTSWRPVVATISPSATVADLATALGVVRPLYRFEQRLASATSLTESGLLSGDVLGVGEPVPVPWRQLGHELRIIGGVGAGIHRRIDGSGLVLGRDSTADLVVRDRRLSRTHAEVRVTDDGFEVRDLRSSNGVEVEGLPVAVGVAAHAAFGAACRAGDTVFTVAPIAGGGATLRRSDPFHFAFTGGRPPRVPESPTWVETPAALSPPSRRSVVPFVVPTAGALALAATASGAPVVLAFSATPVALAAALAAERVLQTRHARVAATDHAATVERARGAYRDELVAFAQATRAAASDPIALCAAAEHRRVPVWSVEPQALRVRLGLVSPEGVLTPYTVPLSPAPLVVAGSEPVLDALFVWMVLQAVALVSPSALDVVVVTDDDGWNWTAWLPHRSDLTVLSGDARPTDLPKRRAPRRLVVLDRPSSAQWAGDSALPADDLFMWRSGSEVEVPNNASVVVSAASSASVRVEDASGVRDDVLVDALDDPVAFASQCALALARLQAPFGALVNVRQPVSISDVVPALACVDDLLAAWRQPLGPLRATIGVDESGPLEVVFDGQNSHALIAGTTGSGKTRLLESLVLGLAATRSPAELNVLIIDFKGGNELASVASLPHCVGLVSDRASSEVDRAISALTREIARRDELFASVGAADLADFAAKTGAAPPRLVVIADEFGQFRRDDTIGARVSTLLRIAAQGRSKGIHLVLATQSPSTDVTPEIRQNIGLRLCLRVAESAESVAVIGVPDAMRLPGPGHVLIARDNELRSGRVAMARLPDVPESVPVRISELAEVARGRLKAAPAVDGDLLDRLIANVVRAADTVGVTAAVLLAPPLPERVLRRSLPHAHRSWKVGGLVLAQRDRPGIADPPPFCFDLERDASMTIVGGARSGRTTTLLALAEAARDQATDRSLVVHAIAWAHGLEQLDGVEGDGGVVLRGDYDHLRRTAAWLANPPDDGVTRLVLIDRFDALLRDVRDLDGGAFAHQLLEVLQDGPRRRIATAVTTEPTALLTGGAAALAGVRLVLSIDDPTMAAAAGVPRRAATRPGRGVAANGDDVQIGVPESVEAASGVLVSRVDRMPTIVSHAGLTPESGERVVFGVGGATQVAPLVIDLDAVGPVIVVIGRPGSGRSGALAAIADSYRGARNVVSITADQQSDWSPSDRPALVLVDDAVRSLAANPWLGDEELPAVLRAGGHVAVVVFDQADLTGLGFRHWLPKRTFPGLLLSLDATPDRIVAGERLGFLPPVELRTGPVGRGWWCWRGAGIPVQVAVN